MLACGSHRWPGSHGGDSVTLEVAETKTLVTGKLSVQGMTCAACSGAAAARTQPALFLPRPTGARAATITNHLNSLPGVRTATVSLLMESAEIVFDPAQTKLEDLAAAVGDVGADRGPAMPVARFAEIHGAQASTPLP